MKEAARVNHGRNKIFKVDHAVLLVGRSTTAQTNIDVQASRS